MIRKIGTVFMDDELGNLIFIESVDDKDTRKNENLQSITINSGLSINPATRETKTEVTVRYTGTFSRFTTKQKEEKVIIKS